MRYLAALLLLAFTAPDASADSAVITTLEDADLTLVLPTPGVGLPTPAQTVPLGLPAGFRGHGVAYTRVDEALVADFNTPRVARVRVSDATVLGIIPLTGRTFGTGSLAVSPGGDYAISAGELGAVGELAVVRGLTGANPSSAPIANAPRVRSFSTQSIAFAPDGRAAICHTAGVSLMEPPYTGIAFTVPLPPVTSATSCRLSRDGQRLFLTRAGKQMFVVDAPFTPTSPVITIAAPADADGLVPMAVSPDGNAVLVAQAFQSLANPQRARLYITRAPYTALSTLTEIALPFAIAGDACTGLGGTRCSGFEEIDVDAAGTLAIATGNSSRFNNGLAGRAPALFIANPFNDATRTLTPVTIGETGTGTDGRGTGGVRFVPFDAVLLANGFEG